jgi:hypothetical protein
MLSKHSRSSPKDVNRRSSRRMSSGKEIKYSEMVCSEESEEEDSSDHDSSSHEEYSESVVPSKGRTPPRRIKKCDLVDASSSGRKIALDKSPVPKSTPRKRSKGAPVPPSPVILLDDDDDDEEEEEEEDFSNSQSKKLIKRKKKVDDDEDGDSPAPIPTASRTARQRTTTSAVRNSQRSKSQVNYIELSSDDESFSDQNEKKRKRGVTKSKVTRTPRRSDNEEEDAEWSE